MSPCVWILKVQPYVTVDLTISNFWKIFKWCNNFACTNHSTRTASQQTWSCSRLVLLKFSKANQKRWNRTLLFLLKTRAKNYILIGAQIKFCWCPSTTVMNRCTWLDFSKPCIIANVLPKQSLYRVYSDKHMMNVIRHTCILKDMSLHWHRHVCAASPTLSHDKSLPLKTYLFLIRSMYAACRRTISNSLPASSTM